MHERFNSSAPIGERVRALEVCAEDLDKRVSQIEFFNRDALKDTKINFDRIIMVLGFGATLAVSLLRH